ncbi:hypothetical protein H4R33_001097 [Dimargaris cristalligena]|nr:hypothetical protein H4R33_001097 [Dimargaris cristalligena]
MVDSASMTSRSAPDIPQIPLSSLTQLSIVYAHSVAAAGQKLAKAKRNSGAPGSVGLAQLRRLIEEDKIQRNRLAHIHQTMAQIAQRRITEWSPETLALCLTSIDTQMIERIDIDDLERRLEAPELELPPAVVPGLHFYDYLYHAWSHELVSTLADRDSGLFFRVAQQLLEVAQVALHTYRNLNATVLISRILQSPEIQAVLEHVPVLATALQNRIRNSTLAEHAAAGEPRSYGAILRRTLSGAYHHPSTAGQSLPASGADRPVVWVIPCLTHHLADLQTVSATYATTQQSAQLSVPGLAKRQTELQLLRACLAGPVSVWADLDLPRPVSTPHPTVAPLAGFPHTRSFPRSGPNLLDLPSSDLTIHHWLLTRPYLTRTELQDEIRALLPSLEPASWAVPIPVSPVSPDPPLDVVPSDSVEEVTPKVATPPPASVVPPPSAASPTPSLQDFMSYLDDHLASAVDNQVTDIPPPQSTEDPPVPSQSAVWAQLLEDSTDDEFVYTQWATPDSAATKPMLHPDSSDSTPVYHERTLPLNPPGLDSISRADGFAREPEPPMPSAPEAKEIAINDTRNYPGDGDGDNDDDDGDGDGEEEEDDNSDHDCDSDDTTQSDYSEHRECSDTIESEQVEVEISLRDLLVIGGSQPPLKSDYPTDTNAPTSDNTIDYSSDGDDDSDYSDDQDVVISLADLTQGSPTTSPVLK